jgi:non-canonical (house-cleaning) NTP pyrophosphatase
MKTPTWDVPEIERRQGAIQVFVEDEVTRGQLKALLKHVMILALS